MGGHARVYTGDGPHLVWRDAVIAACLEQYKGRTIEGGVWLSIEYRMERPRGHWGAGRNAGSLRPSAPVYWHIQKPDRDNLDKGTKDGITKAGVWKDDRLVCDGPSRKIWCPPGCEPGATIRIQEVDDGELPTSAPSCGDGG